MVSGPRVVRSCALKTDPTILSRLPHSLGSSLIVASVLRSRRFGMKSVVNGLAVGTSAWAGREFAAAETRSRDGHGVVCVLRYLR